MKFKSIFLLTVFLFLKIGVAHSLSHTFSHDDLNDCEECFLIVKSNKTQTFDGVVNSYNNELLKEIVLQKPIALSYKNPVFRNQNNAFFFNKPPPFHYL